MNTTMHPRRNGKPSYEENEVVESLRKKRDIYIPKESKEVQILYGDGAKNDIGIRSRGKLDFLRKFCNYHIFTTKKFQN